MTVYLETAARILAIYRHEEKEGKLHMVRDGWNHFAMTGSVHDYLAYKNQESRKSNREEVRGEECRGHECDDNRACAYSNADQRI